MDLSRLVAEESRGGPRENRGSTGTRTEQFTSNIPPLSPDLKGLVVGSWKEYAGVGVRVSRVAAEERERGADRQWLDGGGGASEEGEDWGYTKRCRVECSSDIDLS
eukprot:401233-Hanusia_phi.AAC.1